MNHTDYYNWKGFYSVVTQGVVDYQYRFMDVYTGWPGGVHDAHMFAHSSLYKLGVNSRLLPDTKQSIGGTEVPLYLIADSAYPMLTWLMKPFLHNSSLSAEQRTYNYHICRARIVVENAFGRLKARWRRVSKPALKPGRVIRVTFSLGHPGLTRFTIYPGLTRIGSREKRNCSFDDVELINAIA